MHYASPLYIHVALVILIVYPFLQCSSQEIGTKHNIRHGTCPPSNISSSSTALGPVSNMNDSGIDTIETTVDSNRDRGLNRKELFVTGFILGTVLCETMAYFSVIGNLVLYCTTRLQFTAYESINVALVFSGKTFLFVCQPISALTISQTSPGFYVSVV